ncbi:TPA: hypothetical protein HA249_05950 [Candidatus Woesearchaeota archaeon]|nr:hypothetical protein [Candidatus Woesearchaeota archaeon]
MALVTFLLTTTVFAGMIVVEETYNGALISYDVSIPMEKGWNLVLGAGALLEAAPLGFSAGSEVKFGNLKAMYVYNPSTREYVRILPGVDREKIATFVSTGDLLSIPYWLYSDKAGTLQFRSRGIPAVHYRQLYSGWNLVGISPEMEGRTFQELFSGCTVEKSFIYNNKVYTGHTEPSWERVYEDSKFEDNAMGYGMAVKVTGQCTMAAAPALGGTPPALPGN